jgi:hypothetical protein
LWPWIEKSGLRRFAFGAVLAALTYALLSML